MTPTVRAHLLLSMLQSPDGDLIDCVAAHLQPAFDHPRLRGQRPLVSNSRSVTPDHQHPALFSSAFYYQAMEQQRVLINKITSSVSVRAGPAGAAQGAPP